MRHFGSRLDQPSADRMLDRSRPHAHERDPGAAELRRKAPPEECQRHSRGTVREVVQHSRPGYDQQVQAACVPDRADQAGQLARRLQRESCRACEARPPAGFGRAEGYRREPESPRIICSGAPRDPAQKQASSASGRAVAGRRASPPASRHCRRCRSPNSPKIPIFMDAISPLVVVRHAERTARSAGDSCMAARCGRARILRVRSSKPDFVGVIVSSVPQSRLRGPRTRSSRSGPNPRTPNCCCRVPA